MAIVNLNNILNAKSLPKRLFLLGAEEYLIEKSIQDIKSKFNFEFEILDSIETSIFELFDKVNSFSMFEQNKAIISRNFQLYFQGRIKKADKSLEVLEKFMNSSLDHHNLILCASSDKLGNIKKIAAPYKNMIQEFDSCHFPKIWEDKLANWLIDQASMRNIPASQKVINIILSQTPNNLRDLSNQLDKIETFMLGTDDHTEDEIIEIVGNSRSYNIFELTKAITQRNLDLSLLIIENIYNNSKTGLTGSMSVLYNFFIKVLLCFQARSENSDNFALAKAIGVSPFFVKDYLNCCNKYNIYEIENSIVLISEVDLVSKSSSKNLLFVYQELIIKIIDGK